MSVARLRITINGTDLTGAQMDEVELALMEARSAAAAELELRRDQLVVLGELDALLYGDAPPPPTAVVEG